MVIIILADIHGSLHYLSKIADQLAKADLVLIAGDITNFGDHDDAQDILTAIIAHNSNILAVTGNCDLPEVNDYLQDKNIGLHCNSTKVCDVTFMGVSGSLPCPGHTPNESTEQQFGACLKRLEEEATANNPIVFVTHQPAYDTDLDLAGMRHTGSRSIRDFIIDNQPMLAVSGHMHDAVGIDKLGDTTLLNPGPFREGSYAYVEIEDGIRKIELCRAE